MKPRFHETVLVPTTGRSQGIRVVITDSGILLPLLMFFRKGEHRFKSLAWQAKAGHAVGTLYDYMQVVPVPDSLTERESYLSNFVQKLMIGTIPESGNDETGLYWHSSSWGSVAEIVRYANSFSDFCTKKFGIEPLNQLVEASFSQRLATFRHLDIQNDNSLFKHLGNRKVFWREAALSHEVVVPNRPKGAKLRPPFFPREEIIPLLEKGLRIRSTGEVWKKYSIRDLMIVVLQRFGGLREGEPFHLFVTDVIEDPLKRGHAEVRLYHPEIGRFGYWNNLANRVVHETRTEFLRMRYGRRPRNCLFGKERAGWKQLLLDVTEPENYALVRWFPANWGQVFWDLYKVYRNEVLPSGLDHPYLFVNLSETDQYGAPYRISAYNENLRAAVERVGLVFDKSRGTTSHGFRHAYGQDLTDADVPQEIMQVCLHHNSVLSQEKYKRPTISRLNRELNEGLQRLQSANLSGYQLQNVTSDLQEYVNHRSI